MLAIDAASFDSILRTHAAAKVWADSSSLMALRTIHSDSPLGGVEPASTRMIPKRVQVASCPTPPTMLKRSMQKVQAYFPDAEPVAGSTKSVRHWGHWSILGPRAEGEDRLSPPFTGGDSGVVCRCEHLFRDLSRAFGVGGEGGFGLD